MQQLNPITSTFSVYLRTVLPAVFTDDLSYYEQLCKLQNYIKELIDANNLTVSAVQELQGLYTTLETYVNTYFTNLDVQDEINNKLDEMVTDGTLVEIVSSYLQIAGVLSFDNIEDMKLSTNLINGSTAKTLGYYNVNDGGSAIYKIRNITNEDDVDESYIVALNNVSLVAELIVNETVNIKQLGAINENDIKPYLDKYTNNLNKYKNKLLIPRGNWLCSGFITDKEIDIEGYNDFAGSTIISSIQDQNYIFKLHKESGLMSHWSLKNICFASSNFTVGCCLELSSAQYGNVYNISFQNVKGQAMILKNCWEINFTDIIIRHVASIVNGENKGCIEFASSSLGNISTLYFNQIQCEYNFGHLFTVDPGVSVQHNYIGQINYESVNVNEATTDLMINGVINNIISDNKTFALFKLYDECEIVGLVIDAINLNNYGSNSLTYNNNEYAISSIFAKNDNIYVNQVYNVLVNNLCIIACKTKIYITDWTSEHRANIKDNLRINSISYSYTDKELAYKGNYINGIDIPNIQIEKNFIDYNIIGSDLCLRNNIVGNICYDPTAKTKNRLVYRNSNVNGVTKSFFSTGNNLIIYAKNNSQQTIKLKNITANIEWNITLETYSDYLARRIDLTTLSGYTVGHEYQFIIPNSYSVSIAGIAFY